MTTRELLMHRPDILAVIIGFMAVGLETYALITLDVSNAVKWALAFLLLSAVIVLLYVVYLIKNR